VLPQTLTYLSLAFAFAITPGATTAVVIRHTLESGRRKGLTASAGAQVASALQATFAIAGVGVLLGRWPGGLKALGYAGALFLAWIGIKSLRAAFRGAAPRVEISPDGRTTASAPRGHTPFRDGFTVNILNPSITSFYIGVVPTFVPPGSTWRTLAFFYSAHIAIAFLCHVFWTSIFNQARAFFAGERPRRWLDAVVGTLLLYLCARIIGRL
jgi:threonine/homoserine/homoserine lactone efflux protein